MRPMQSSRSSSDVGIFRQFNRAYTQLIGTLNEGLLSTEHSLAEARVLYELATRPQAKAKEISSALDLDQGYLSRMLAKFESQDLIRRKSSKEDSRSAELELTRKGRTAFDRLDALSDKQARSILEKLSPSERNELIQSMSTIKRILLKADAGGPLYTLRPHGPGDMGWVVYREATLYAEEYGWDNTFELLVLGIVTDFLRDFDAKCERCWIAEVDKQNVGHVFLVKDKAQLDAAKLRLLLVEPCARGKGLGRALVNECIRFARASGYRKITLWTQSMLLAAHRIYEQAGFRLVKEESHHSFGKDLVGQTWEMELVSSAGG
ncbi:MAG: MarR family transcriptional regulator [Acidobacteriaceae bacterium]|nr:MarR family transcriptional regulator [Acidobacteriaceae bacterium]